jgi:hypothetical protein
MNIKIAFKTTNTIGNILRKTTTTNRYDHMGICKLTLADGCKSYIGQTGRSLNIRYNELIRSIKYNMEDSEFATRILRNAHQYGKIDDIMERIDYSAKGRMMNMKENFYIYLYKHNNTLIDKHKIGKSSHSDILFDIAIQCTDTPP